MGTIPWNWMTNYLGLPAEYMHRPTCENEIHLKQEKKFVVVLLQRRGLENNPPSALLGCGRLLFCSLSGLHHICCQPVRAAQKAPKDISNTL